MTFPLPNPEAPPPEPPLGLWTSLGALALGLALAAYVAAAVWRRTERRDTEDDARVEPSSESSERDSPETEHSDEDVV